jgi:hypothetical protein
LAEALGPWAAFVKAGPAWQLARRGASGYTEAMLDRLYLPTLALAAAIAVAIAMVWPQGLGDRSPDPFGHEPVQRAAAVQAAMKRESEAAKARVINARQAVREMQAPSMAGAK